MSWMEEDRQKVILSDVDSATQYGTIGGQDTRNTSKITDVGFQSYLTSAPVPRAYFKATTTTTAVNNAETVLAWVQADVVFDDFAMFAGGNNFRLPIDGFYSINADATYTPPIGGGAYYSYFVIRSQGGSYPATSVLGLQSQIPTNLATPSLIGYNMTIVKPFRAGDLFNIALFQLSSANEAIINSDQFESLGICWMAPYKNYVGGNNG